MIVFWVKKRIFFLEIRFIFSLKTRRKRESLESVLVWEHSMLKRKKSILIFPSQRFVQSSFWASPIRFTIKIKTHTVLCVSLWMYVNCIQFCPPNESSIKKKSFNCSFESSFFYFRLFEISCRNCAMPWMSKARQSLTVLWSPILQLPVCAWISVLIRQMIYSLKLKCILWPFCTMTCLFVYVHAVTKRMRECDTPLHYAYIVHKAFISLYRVLCCAVLCYNKCR